MDKKKILIVCRWFYPENTPRAHRATELAKEFSVQGHSVTVLTPKETELHEQFEHEHQLTIKDLGKSRWRNPNFGNSKLGGFMSRATTRLLQLSIEYPNIEWFFKVKNALHTESGYDLLISIAVPYPVHWGVAKVWKRCNNKAKTWIADCGDPYMGNTTDSFKKWFYFKWVEKWFMRKADFITIPVESARNAYYKEFHPKIHIISQGFKIENTDYSKYYKPNEVPSFIYAGGFIPNIRDPRPFLDYLVTLNRDFRFYIYTNNRPLVETYINKLGEKLIVSDYIIREDLLQRIASMDFVVNFDNNTQTAVPSKLIDYAIAERPVLNIKKELDKENIVRFLDGDYAEKLEMPEVDNYRIENVCKSFLKLSDAK